MKEILKRIPVLLWVARSLKSKYRNYNNIKRVKYMARSGQKVRVVIGASSVFEDGWIATDIEYMNLLNTAHWERSFKKGSVDAFLAEHVWEHLSREEGLIAAKNCFNYLKTGGYLRVAVPDGLHPSPEYISHVKVGADGHRELYDYKSFTELFEEAGFEVNLLEYCDNDGEFRSCDWDITEGKIHRSKRYSEKDTDYVYTSLIIDAYKR